jgi:3-oxoacyl-[acyl-carrier protein] reductase
MSGDPTWELAMRTNVMGTVHACREVAKIMMRQREGRIVTVSSMAASLHIEGSAPYAASKAAIVELTKVLARELAPVGVTCNAVSVSVALTESLESLGSGVPERALEKLTIKRPLSIDEICHAVAFLADTRSSALTGQVLHLGMVT